MNNFTFTTLYVLRLSFDNVLGLIKSTISMAIAVKTQLGDLGNAALNQLIEDYEKFAPSVKNPRKTELEDLVLLTNDERKERIAEIKRTVKVNMRGHDPKKKVAAEALDVFFSNYWIVIIESLNSMTGDLKGMFKKYKADPEIQAAAIAIEIDKLIVELEGCNNDFEDLNDQRIAVEAVHELSVSEQKATICNSYSQFCNNIEQAANLMPSESIIMLFKDMDELRIAYHGLIPNGKDTDEADPDEEAEN